MIAVRRLSATLVVMCVALAGCSTQQIARFETRVGSTRCAQSGLAEGSAAHQQCVTAYAAAAEQERANTRAGMLGVLGVSTQVWSAEQQGRAAAVSTRDATTTYELRSDVLQDWEHICRYADNTVINSGRDRCPPSITGR